MPTSPNRTAANQANAQHSTGPKSAEGKARSSQNARKHPFNPDPFAVVRIEDPALVAALFAGAIATYQPINSQEREAVQRIAVGQHVMRRMSMAEAGFFTNCLDKVMESPGKAFILDNPEITYGLDVKVGQNRAYWLAFGFDLYTRQGKTVERLLRMQAQAERLYRRAVEDFERLFKLRGQLPPEKYQDDEPKVEPQPVENTAEPVPAPVEQTQDEPKADPSPAPATAPDREPPGEPRETPDGGNRHAPVPPCAATVPPVPDRQPPSGPQGTPGGGDRNEPSPSSTRKAPNPARAAALKSEPQPRFGAAPPPQRT